MAENVQVLVESYVAKLYDMTVISPSKVSELKRALDEELQNIPNLHILAEKRNVQLQYREYEIESRVTSLADFVYQSFQVAIKAVASDSGDLMCMPAESTLCRSSGLGKGSVNKALLAEAIMAREWASKVVRAAEPKNGQEMLDRRGYMLV